MSREQEMRDAFADRVTEAVRRALALVGPAEHSVERLGDEPSQEGSPDPSGPAAAEAS
jgi:hypothetical protein